jgi:hypothetical protein
MNMNKKTTITLIDCMRFAEPHYKVVEATNFIQYKMGDQLTEAQVKDLVDMTQVEVKIRVPRNSDFE